MFTEREQKMYESIIRVAARYERSGRDHRRTHADRIEDLAAAHGAFFAAALMRRECFKQ